MPRRLLTVIRVSGNGTTIKSTACHNLERDGIIQENSSNCEAPQLSSRGTSFQSKQSRSSTFGVQETENFKAYMGSGGKTPRIPHPNVLCDPVLANRWLLALPRTKLRVLVTNHFSLYRHLTGGTEKTHENLSQDRLPPRQDLNPGPPV